jgi:hypothetical protein
MSASGDAALAAAAMTIPRAGAVLCFLCVLPVCCLQRGRALVFSACCVGLLGCEEAVEGARALSCWRDFGGVLCCVLKRMKVCDLGNLCGLFFSLAFVVARFYSSGRLLLPP